MKRLVLPAAAAESAAAEGRQGYPYEICGALIGHQEGEVLRVQRVASFPNVADETQRRRRFAIDPVAILRLERELRGSGEQLLGFYHSHPDHEAAPSVTDMEYFRLWPETAWLIVPVRQGEPGPGRAWWLARDAEQATEIPAAIE